MAAGWCGRSCLWETDCFLPRLGPLATRPGSALSLASPPAAPPSSRQDSRALSAATAVTVTVTVMPGPRCGQTGLGRNLPSCPHNDPKRQARNWPHCRAEERKARQVENLPETTQRARGRGAGPLGRTQPPVPGRGAHHSPTSLTNRVCPLPGTTSSSPGRWRGHRPCPRSTAQSPSPTRQPEETPWAWSRSCCPASSSPLPSEPLSSACETSPACEALSAPGSQDGQLWEPGGRRWRARAEASSQHSSQ